MRMSNLETAILAAWAIERTPHIIGVHGIGKSSKVRQICEKNGYKMMDVRLGQMADPGDLTGLPEFSLDGKGNKFTDFILPALFPREENTVIFLDEINRCSKDLLQAVFELIYDKSLKGYKLPKNCHVIAASNPATDDYAVLDFSDSAFQDRFIHLKLQPTVEEFLSYSRSKYPNSAAADFLEENEKMLEEGKDFQIDFVKPSRRSWENGVMPLEQLLDKGEISEDVFNEMVIGIVGMVAAPVYFTFRKTHVGSIKATDVIENYSKVQKKVIQTREKGRFDILGTLVNSIGEELSKNRKGLELKEAKNLIELVKDLPPEQMQALCTLFSTVAFDTCSNVKGMPDGLLNNDELFEIVNKAREIVRQAAAEEEKKGKKKTKKTGTEEL